VAAAWKRAEAAGERDDQWVDPRETSSGWLKRKDLLTEEVFQIK
jgi:hypothetical protein